MQLLDQLNTNSKAKLIFKASTHECLLYTEIGCNSFPRGPLHKVALGVILRLLLICVDYSLSVTKLNKSSTAKIDINDPRA